MNWMRRTEQSMDRASALASMVLPTPGTSSISRWPSASRTVSESRTTSGLPSITFSTDRRTRSAVVVRSLRLARASKVVTRSSSACSSPGRRSSLDRPSPLARRSPVARACRTSHSSPHGAGHVTRLPLLTMRCLFRARRGSAGSISRSSRCVTSKTKPRTSSGVGEERRGPHPRHGLPHVLVDVVKDSTAQVGRWPTSCSSSCGSPR